MPSRLRGGGAGVLALALAASGLSACRELTAPGPQVVVTLGSLVGPAVSVDTSGYPLITCVVGLRAAATGNGQADWEDAVFRWYAGKNPAAPFDTVVVADSMIRRSWGSGVIAAGQSEQAGWSLSGRAPFKATIDFHYEKSGGGPVHTASVSLQCGPPADSAGQPPSITTFSTRATGSLQPGDSLVLDYAASSQTGLWETAATLSGPCRLTQVFGEGQQLTVSHTVVFRLPAACQLGVPVNLAVVAWDVALQQAVRTLVLPALIDTTPPTETVMIFPREGGSATSNLAGTWYVGDTLQLLFGASDNHALAALVWQVLPSGLRDSVLVAGASASQWLKIPVPASWLGTTQMKFYARDAAGNVSAAIASSPNAISIVGTAAVTPIVDTTWGGPIVDVAFDPKRGVLYVLHNGSIQAVSLTTYRVLSAIQVPLGSLSFDLSVSGDSLVVLLRATPGLGILDLRQTPPPLTIIPIAGLDTAKKELIQQVRVAANGKALVTTQGIAAGADRLLTLDLATGVQQFRPDAGNGGETGAGELERSYDRSVVILNGGQFAFQRYSSATDAFSPGQTALVRDAHPWVDGNGSNVTISSQLYDANLSFRFFVTCYPSISVGPAALSPDGLTHFLELWGTGVVRSRTSDGSAIDRVPNPINAGLVRVSPDGHTLVTAETDYGPLGRISIVTLP